MGFENGRYVPDDAATIRDRALTLTRASIDDPALSEGAVLRTLLDAQAAVLAANQEPDKRRLYNATFLATATGADLTRKASEYGVERTPAVAATGVVTFSRDSPATQDYTIPSGTVVATDPPEQVRFVTTESVTLADGTTSVDATVRATEAGPDGNVAANTITLAPNGITGVDSLTNSNPTGDPTLTDTSGDALVKGQPREGDDSLRDRALDNPSIGGAGTVPAIKTKLTNIPAVRSATLYVDQTNDTIEPVVFGGTDEAIADALFSVLPVTAQTVGGTNGTGVTVTVSSDTLAGGERTINFSRPVTVQIDVTVDIVITDEYAGDAAVRDAIVNYIGGTNSDGVSVNGTPTVGEDVLITEIERQIESVRGVVAVTALTTTPTITERSSGLDVVAIADNEVSLTDATDGSLTVTTTQQ